MTHTVERREARAPFGAQKVTEGGIESTSRFVRIKRPFFKNKIKTYFKKIDRKGKRRRGGATRQGCVMRDARAKADTKERHTHTQTRTLNKKKTRSSFPHRFFPFPSSLPSLYRCPVYLTPLRRSPSQVYGERHQNIQMIWLC